MTSDNMLTRRGRPRLQGGLAPARDELEDGNRPTCTGRAVSINGERREHAIGELPQPDARGFVVDDFSPEGLAAQEDLGVRARVVEPGGIVWAAGL